MAIQKAFLETTQVIQPGEHVVNIIDVKIGKSKKDKPMLTITFQNQKGQKIRGYFLRDLPYHVDQLRTLKEACGLQGTQSSEDLLGLQCGIAVEKQKPTEDGQVFNQIVGYGLASDVENSPVAEKPKVDEIPW